MAVPSGLKRWERRAQRPPLLARSRVVAGDSGCQRRGRDLNPRRTQRPETVFETVQNIAICREFGVGSPVDSPAGGPRSARGRGDAAPRRRRSLEADGWSYEPLSMKE